MALSKAEAEPITWDMGYRRYDTTSTSPLLLNAVDTRIPTYVDKYVCR